MSSTAWNWLLTIVGTMASMAGVVFSLLAWRQASKAKDAARDAAEAIRTRNLSHDFSRWSVDARELLRSVREFQFENARQAATDLFGALAHNRGWQAGLKRESLLAEVDEVVRLLKLINTYMAEREVFEGKQAEVAEFCLAVYRKFNEVAGYLDAQAENL